MLQDSFNNKLKFQKHKIVYNILITYIVSNKLIV